MDAGLELSEYIMPGIGGRTLSEEHARETASRAEPDTSPLHKGEDLCHAPCLADAEDGAGGDVRPHGGRRDSRRVRLLVESLDEMHSYFSSNDFSLNLLMEVDGFLDEKKASC